MLTLLNVDRHHYHISECVGIEDLQKDEPMKGLSRLILGSAYCIGGQIELGIESFRKCLNMRQNLTPNSEDAHISAFSQYELGSLLLKNEQVSFFNMKNKTVIYIFITIIMLIVVEVQPLQYNSVA